MSKKIMLTILALCVTIGFTGCKNGNLNFESDKASKSNTLISGEQLNIASGDENPEEDNTSKTNEVYKYNESGKIIIAMYHKFQDTETDAYTRSFENFEKDLEYLYEHNYRTISLNDYLTGNIKVPVGCTPIVLTFDDATKGQFNLIKDEEGNLVVNPKSAVGIMEAFYEKHPDFGLNGTFYINGSAFFPGEGTNKERLLYLIDKGFEIGNHTNTHVYLNKASQEQIIKEIGIVNNLVYDLTGYKINSLALPFGITSNDFADSIAKGTYEGIEYENKIVLLVGANPALPANSEKVNLLRLPRVRATGGGKEVECDLTYWLRVMENNPSMKYERIEE